MSKLPRLRGRKVVGALRKASEMTRDEFQALL